MDIALQYRPHPIYWNHRQHHIRVGIAAGYHLDLTPTVTDGRAGTLAFG